MPEPRHLPLTRADCPELPCPFISCRHHLWSHVTKAGRLLILHADGELRPPAEDFELPLEELHLPTCSLDVAEQGGIGVVEIAENLGITRPTQLADENRAFDKIREELREWR